MANGRNQGRRGGVSPEAQAQGSAVSTAIAKRRQHDELVRRPVTEVAQLRDQFEELSKHFIVLSPVVQVDQLPPMSQVSKSLVVIDTVYDKKRGGNGDVYFDRRFCDDGWSPSGTDPRRATVALAKGALMRIAAAAGIQKLSSRPAKEPDDPKSPYFVRWATTIVGKRYDGQWRQLTAHKRVDLRDGEPEAMQAEWACKTHGTDPCRCAKNNFEKTGRSIPMAAGALSEKRIHIESLAETKSYERAIREWFGLPHVMKVTDLEKGIIVPSLVPALDMNDPDVKREVIKKQVWGDTALYGNQAPMPQLGSASVSEDSNPRAIVEPVAQPLGIEPPKVLDPDRDDPVIEAPAAVVQEAIPVDAAAPADDQGPLGPEPPPPLEDAPAAPPAPASGDCSCPLHACSNEVSSAQKKRSQDRIKVVRCEGCYPGPAFDQDLHPDKSASLQIAGYPNATPAQVAKWNRDREASNG